MFPLLRSPCSSRLLPFLHLDISLRSTHQMRVLQLLHNRNVVQLDVQVLVHALESSSYRNVVFQFHCDFVIDQSFEEAEEQHGGGDDEGGELIVIVVVAWAVGGRVVDGK